MKENGFIPKVLLDWSLIKSTITNGHLKYHFLHIQYYPSAFFLHSMHLLDMGALNIIMQIKALKHTCQKKKERNNSAGGWPLWKKETIVANKAAKWIWEIHCFLQI